MKRIVEGQSISDTITKVKDAINDETKTIALYDEMLGMSLPAHARQVIEEIRDDEKDHLVLLTNLLQDIVEDELPGFGDEDEMMAIEDEDDEQ